MLSLSNSWQKKLVSGCSVVITISCGSSATITLVLTKQISSLLCVSTLWFHVQTARVQPTLLAGFGRRWAHWCVFHHIFFTREEMGFVCASSVLSVAASRMYAYRITEVSSTWKVRLCPEEKRNSLCWRAVDFFFLESLDAQGSVFYGVITLNRKQRPLYWRITNHMKQKGAPGLPWSLTTDPLSASRT